MQWLTPWEPVTEVERPGERGRDFRAAWERELRREVGPRHVLYGAKAALIARHFGTDDALFLLKGGRVAEVHLTWCMRRERGPRWPATAIYPSLEVWGLTSMAEWHRVFEDLDGDPHGTASAVGDVGRTVRKEGVEAWLRQLVGRIGGHGTDFPRGAELWGDLWLSGDDAGEVLQAISHRFGTSFAGMYFPAYFPDETSSLICYWWLRITRRRSGFKPLSFAHLVRVVEEGHWTEPGA